MLLIRKYQGEKASHSLKKIVTFSFHIFSFLFSAHYSNFVFIYMTKQNQ